MRLWLALLVTVAVASASQQIPADVRDGWYAGRSGNVILKPAAPQVHDGAVIFSESGASRYLRHAGADVEQHLAIQHVADAVTRALGVQPPNPDYEPHFVAADLFHRPAANVMFAFESVGKDMLSSPSSASSLPQLNSLWSSSASVARSLSEPTYPASSLATAASIATGAKPSAHGIVAPTWKHNDADVRAYSSAEASSQRATVADILTQTFGGRSLNLAVSAKPVLARAFGVHPSVSSAEPSWHNYLVSASASGFGPLSDAAAPADAAAALRASTDALYATTAKLFDVQGTKVTVQLPTAGSSSSSSNSNSNSKVVFDLTVPEHALLFAEIAYASSLPDALTASPHFSALLHDDAPDSFTFVFAALTGLIEKYGRDSAEVRGALAVLDRSTPALLQKWTALASGGRAISELVLLGSHPTLAPSSSAAGAVDARAARATIGRLLPAQDVSTYPQLYVHTERLWDTCQVLQLQLQPSGLNVHCPDAAQHHTSFMQTQANLFALQAKPHIAFRNTSAKVKQYQTKLWISILGAIFALWAVYTLAFMAFKRDTLLYSTFNPHWESRKRA